MQVPVPWDFFIAIAALKCHDPFLYILAALVLIIDGGLGLVKLTLIKTIHVHILKNVRTPIHDFVRKTKGWSNTQTVFSFRYHSDHSVFGSDLCDAAVERRIILCTTN